MNVVNPINNVRINSENMQQIYFIGRGITIMIVDLEIVQDDRHARLWSFMLELVRSLLQEDTRDLL